MNVHLQAAIEHLQQRADDEAESGDDVTAAHYQVECDAVKAMAGMLPTPDDSSE